jgi:4-oxalocrotonate tautomerase
MPVVTVEWVSGRSKEQREKVAKAINEAMVNIGKAPENGTYILFKDVPGENWAVGDKLVSDS